MSDDLLFNPTPPNEDTIHIDLDEPSNPLFNKSSVDVELPVQKPIEKPIEKHVEQPVEQQVVQSILEGKVSPDPNKTGNGLLTEQISSLTAERNRLYQEVDKYKKLSTSYSDLLNKAEEKIKYFEDSKMVFDAKLKDKDNQIAHFENLTSQAQEHIKTLTNIAQNNKDAYEKVTKELDKVKNSANVSDELKEELANKSKELLIKQGELSNLQTDFAKLKEDLEIVKSSLDSAESSYKELLEIHEELKKHSQQLQETINSLTAQSSEDNSELVEQLQKELDELRFKLADSLASNENSFTQSLINSEKLRQIEETITNNRKRYEDLENSFKEREADFFNREIEYKDSINALKSEITGLKLDNQKLKTSYECVEVDLKVAREELINERKAKEIIQVQLDATKSNEEELLEKISSVERELSETLSQSLTLRERLNILMNYPIFKELAITPEELLETSLETIEDKLSVTPDSVNKEVEELKAELEKLSASINDYKEKLNEAEYRKTFLKQETERYESLLKESSEQTSLLESKLEASEKALGELESLKSELEKQVASLTEKCKAQEVQLSTTISTVVSDTASNEELAKALKRIEELEKTNAELNSTIKDRNASISSYKSSESDFRNEIAKLNKTVKELADSKGDSKSVEDFTNKVFNMTPEQLFQKFNEFSVTFEVANYNLEAMEQFPQARAVVDKLVNANKPKLASILTRKYEY